MENYDYQPPQYDDLSGAASASGDISSPELQKGQTLATISMVLGIVGLAIMLITVFYGAFISVIAGVSGLICAIMSKSSGYVGATRTAGLIMAIINIALGTLISIACVSCLAMGMGYGL